MSAHVFLVFYTPGDNEDVEHYVGTHAALAGARRHAEADAVDLGGQHWTWGEPGNGGDPLLLTDWTDDTTGYYVIREVEVKP